MFIKNIRDEKLSQNQEYRKLISGDLKIDLASQEVWVQVNKIKLSSIEYQLLLVLACRPKQPIPHDEVLDSAWGAGCRDSGQIFSACVER